MARIPFGPGILGQSPAMLNLRNAAALVALSRAPVLVRGESGSGKQTLARAMHDYAGGGDFHVLDGEAPADVPRELRPAATLYVDEVGTLSPRLQARLLALLEGEREPAPRVIAATRVDLQEAVTRGAFSPDLFYRLDVVPLEVPPLRERPEDVGVLLAGFTERLAARKGLPAPEYSGAAVRELQRYPWPGNVRELHRLAERLLLLMPGRPVAPENLPGEIRRLARAAGPSVLLPDGGLNLAGLEADLIAQALERCAGNRSGAARLLGLSRDTLLYRMHKYAIGG